MIKVICDKEDIDILNFQEKVIVAKQARKWTLTNSKCEQLDIKFQIHECNVKYTPEKYDKITLNIDICSMKLFQIIQEKIKETVNIQDIIKNNSIGLKLPKAIKQQVLASLNQGDYIDVIIKFNDIWTVNKKHYVSLELLQFRKLDKAPKVETINYFIDDN